jgi:hypothetical protein
VFSVVYRQLEGDAKYGKVHRLLTIFLTGAHGAAPRRSFRASCGKQAL